MNNKTSKNFITILLGTGISALLGVITVPIITRLVTPSEYGFFSLLQTYGNIIITICLLGLDQGYVRFYYMKDTIDYKKKLSRLTIKYPLLLSMLASIIIFYIGKFYIDINFVTLISICFCIVFTVINTFTQLNLRMEQKTFLYSLTLIIHRIVFALVVILCIFLLNISGINSLLLGTFISLGLTIIIVGFNQSYIWLQPSKENVKVDFKKILKYSSPFIFSMIANWLFNATDKLVLQYFSTFEEIGYYSAATTIVALVTILQTAFSTLWVPLAIQNFEKQPNNKGFFIKSNDVVVFVMITIGSTLVLFKDIFGWLLGSNYEVAQYIFPFLILQPIMFTISETTVYGINFYQKTRWHIVITFTSSIFNIIGNFSLVPILGAKGAAISTGISYILFFVLRTMISQYYYSIKFNYNKMGSVLSLFLIFLIHSSFTKTNLVSLILYLVIILTSIFLYKASIVAIIKNDKSEDYNLL